MTKARITRKRARVLACIAALLLLVVMSPRRAEAALLRGRLVRALPNGQIVPVPGVSVTVYRSDMGRSNPSITDGNGMYYLNIPAGVYMLEVWITNPPRAYQIQVVEPGTDIPPIYV